MTQGQEQTYEKEWEGEIQPKVSFSREPPSLNPLSASETFMVSCFYYRN